ncbi:hypothetical protein Tco_0794991 [Tanacetum coccineum]
MFTPLFEILLVQPQHEDKGEVLERPYESQPIPSSTHPSADQPESQPDPSSRPSSPNLIPDSNPEGSGGIIRSVTAQAAEIKDLKAQIKQLKKKAKPRRSVSKQGRKAVKSSKGSPSVHTHTDYDAMDTVLEATLNDAIDYTLTQDEGNTEQQSTVKPDEGTDKQNKEQWVRNRKKKEKGVELMNVEGGILLRTIESPRPTIIPISLLALKPLTKIDPKSKAIGMIEEKINHTY